MYYVCLMPDIRVRTSAVVQEIVSCQKGWEIDKVITPQTRLSEKAAETFQVQRIGSLQPGMDCQDI